MGTALKIEVSPKSIIWAVKNMKATARRAFLQDLIAQRPPNIFRVSVKLAGTIKQAV